MPNNLEYDEENIKEYAKERLGSDFELNKDNAKLFYFAEDCRPIFYHIVCYFKQFSRETLISWNEEYLDTIATKRIEEYYSSQLTFKNMTKYALYLTILNEIYTTNKSHGYMIMKFIKKYINKYGYIMFHALDTEDSRTCKQYPYADLNNCLFYKISERGFKLMDGKRCNLYNIISDKNYYGLIPFAIDNGLDDLYDECIKLLDEVFKKENLFLKEDIMKKMNISYSFNDFDRVMSLSRKYKFDEINDYLKQFEREIK